MNNTLSYTDTVTRIGYTIIGGTKVVQYSCTIPMDNPKDMRITSTRLSPELYKEHRDICRADLAAFEDAAYELQDEYVKKLSN